jgi:hypothetical protein
MVTSLKTYNIHKNIKLYCYIIKGFHLGIHFEKGLSYYLTLEIFNISLRLQIIHK